MTNAATAKPRSGLLKAGKVVTIVGIILTVVLGGGGIVLAVVGLSGVAGSLEDGTEFAGSTRLEVGSMESVQVYAKTADAPPTCQVDGPDGAVEFRGDDDNSTFEDWVRIGTFTSDPAGEYTITCTPSQPMLAAPPISVAGMLAGAGGIAAAFIGGGFALVVLLTGVILWFAGRKRENQPTPHPPGGYQGGTPGSRGGF